eukprot:1186232-Prorocentrum_minimum.AAC.5
MRFGLNKALSFFSVLTGGGFCTHPEFAVELHGDIGVNSVENRRRKLAECSPVLGKVSVGSAKMRSKRSR